MKVFSVHDSKAEAYMTPVFYKTTGEAIRAFETTCRDGQSVFNKFPADFTLVHIGSFDERTAQIISEVPVILANASEFKAQQS